MEKKALGRGLEALLPTSPAGGVVSGHVDMQELSIDSIMPNRYQPRQNFPETELTELATSLKQSGLLQPILVRRKGDGTFELISGERRLRAAKLAGLNKILGSIRNCSDEESMVLALVENVQRSDLNPMEAARAYHRMMNEFGLTQDIIAQKVGRERSSIANFVRLNNLPQEVQQLVESGKLSTGHAKVILGLPPSNAQTDAQIKLARQIVDESLSVREVEEILESEPKKQRKHKPLHPRNPSTEIEERLRKQLGTKVQIKQGRRGGKIIIQYFSPEELDGLIVRLLS